MIMKNRIKFLFFLLILFVSDIAFADRIKDMASVAGVRSNQLVGYGLSYWFS